MAGLTRDSFVELLPVHLQGLALDLFALPPHLFQLARELGEDLIGFLGRQAIAECAEHGGSHPLGSLPVVDAACGHDGAVKRLGRHA